MFEDAKKILEENKKEIPSLLQRKLKIGYNRAVKLVEELKKEGEANEDDSLYGVAKGVVVREKRASASFLQRRLLIGYNQAVRLLDRLEENEIVSP